MSRATARLLVLTSGALVASVVICAPFAIWPAPRPETFIFTVLFLAFQVVTFFGAFGFLPGGFSVVRLGVGTVAALYNAVSLCTVVAYHLLPPAWQVPRVYYTVAVSETVLAVALALLLGLVGVARREGNRAAESARDGVVDLQRRAGQVAARLASRGHSELRMRRLQDAIRFCEGLRSDRGLVDETERRLGDLEVAASSAGPLPDDLDQRIVSLTALIEGRR